MFTSAVARLIQETWTDANWEEICEAIDDIPDAAIDKMLTYTSKKTAGIQKMTCSPEEKSGTVQQWKKRFVELLSVILVYVYLKQPAVADAE